MKTITESSSLIISVCALLSMGFIGDVKILILLGTISVLFYINQTRKDILKKK